MLPHETSHDDSTHAMRPFTVTSYVTIPPPFCYEYRMSIVHVSKKLAFRNIQRSVVYTSIQREGESTGSILSLVLPGRGGWGGVTRTEGVKKAKKRRTCIPRCHQAGPKISSRLNVREKVYSYISSLCCLWSVVQYVQVIDAAGRS